ncbi:YeeE/YedE family protein [Methylobacterium haplocladii]|uniref:Membrane protein n=1 Tax=Methylobacterium haplocladii TaxID=1176176 RepID=A0A512IPJ8_9HYPH|nr:YeeE/YedE family protein [Methylobacterium haplocladii]GEO99626.1 membrane protein [Methylobacterium haplocladii]GLS58195.1 membrane protein [Methylobacterium haplocladii]
MSAPARLVAALGSGLIFGLGLSLSGMLDPARVRGFLDVTGAWDPSLMFVLGGAVTIAALGYQLVRRLPKPAFAPEFQIPTNRRIDGGLIGGSALFGIGWGLSGFCPGPAVAALSTGVLPVAVFVATMLIGMTAYRLVSGS